MNNLGIKHSLVTKIWPVYIKLQNKFFLSKSYMKNVAWKLAPGLFDFHIILCKKDSEEVSMLIWTNFDSFAITYLI